MDDVSELRLDKLLRQEGVKRHSIHEPGCDICAQANPSHGSVPDGSALSSVCAYDVADLFDVAFQITFEVGYK
ncbi:hypothetical protein T01_7064 [Trichinella spiralis]|uniref:Uncharacterized protein n=1 Tax=Trichinella spiralis TaxID=6334 RepID=A0A0V1AV52_TRISP|nr:hypothetical protein T01_7064 [Trichinella spiralis]